MANLRAFKAYIEYFDQDHIYVYGGLTASKVRHSVKQTLHDVGFGADYGDIKVTRIPKYDDQIGGFLETKKDKIDTDKPFFMNDYLIEKGVLEKGEY